MDEPSKSHLKAIVEHRHGLEPTGSEETHVTLEREHNRPIERVVHAFDLPGKACPYRVYAWTERAPDGSKRVVTKVHGPDWRSNKEVLANARLRGARVKRRREEEEG